MKIVDMTVLYFDGPIARAYLTRLRSVNRRPRRLIQLVSTKDARTRKSIGSWLPNFLRKPYCRDYMTAQQTYWPRQILTRHPELAIAAAQSLATFLPEAAGQISEMYADNFRVGNYAPVETVLVDGLEDPRLTAYLESRCDLPILYTGGGLVPETLLKLPGARFLHLHPGFLPLVRGADGLLWSLMLRGRPGISAFWMAAGLDLGNLIATCELQPLTCRLEDRPGDEVLYRALFAYVDPLIRGWFLGEKLEELLVAEGTPQREQDGVTFHFMHPRLKANALQQFFTR